MKSVDKKSDRELNKTEDAHSSAVSLNLNISRVVKQVHMDKTLREIIKLPPSALKGLTKNADDAFTKFRPAVRTIKDLATFEYFLIARAIVTLAKVEEFNGRDIKSDMNINNALDSDHITHCFKDICQL